MIHVAHPEVWDKGFAVVVGTYMPAHGDMVMHSIVVDAECSNLNSIRFPS